MKSSLALAITSILTLYSSLASATVENQVFEGKGLEKLELRNTSGNSRVEASTDGKAYVSATKIDASSSCSVKMNREGHLLVVKVHQGGLFFTGSCKVDLVVKVPESLALNVRSGSGDISVQGTKGEIDFRTGSGSAELNVETAKLIGRLGSGAAKVSGSIGDADVKSGSGDIELSGLRGDARVDTGSGDMRLAFSAVPEKGRLEIRTGSGDATVSLPATTKVLTSFKSGSGKIYNELGDSPDAPFVISAKSGSGDLSIKKLPGN